MLINHVDKSRDQRDIFKDFSFFTACSAVRDETGTNLRRLPVCFRVLQVQTDRSVSRGSGVLLGSGERTELKDVKERGDFWAPRAAPERRVTPGRTARR